MKTKIIPFLILPLLLVFSRSTACSCISIKTFCETLHFDDPNNPQVIVRGKVKDFVDGGIEIVVKQVIFGIVNEQEISAYDLSGTSCQVDLSLLEKNKDFVFALYRRDTQFRSKFSFTIPACGIPFLSIKNGNIVGPIGPGISKLPRSSIQTLMNCNSWSQIEVYPNPTQELLKIRVSSNETKDGQLRIYDSYGRLLLSEGIESQANEEIIRDLSDFADADGLYLVQVIMDGFPRNFRIIVDRP